MTASQLRDAALRLLGFRTAYQRGLLLIRRGFDPAALEGKLWLMVEFDGRIVFRAFWDADDFENLSAVSHGGWEDKLMEASNVR